MSFRVPVALAAWTFASWGATLQAAPETIVAFEYEVASDISGCPDAGAFRASVERQLGYDPFKLGSETRVAVQIARREVGFVGRIQWSDAQGHWVGDRQLSSKHFDCGPIAASLAFSVAVQIQLLATLAPPAPPPPPPPPVRAAPIKVDAPAPAPAPARPLSLSIGFSPSLALGMAPHPTGLARIFASGRFSRLSFELALDAALPASRQVPDGSGFSLDRFAAGAAGCGHVRAFALCVTAALGVLRARGFGVDAPRSPAGTFSQLGARLTATQELGGRYFVAARVDALVMLSSYTVTLNDAAAWTTPRMGVLVGVDVGARIF